MHTVERVLLLVGEVLQRVLEEYLTHEGVHVITCHSEDQLRKMANPTRDVVVLEYWRRGDEQLNDETRRELARVGRIAPTVLLTTHGWARTAQACELGISAILEFPFELESLWAAVRRAISGRSAPALAAWNPQPMHASRLN
jgi:DNA-binding NtrC family response regulator